MDFGYSVASHWITFILFIVNLVTDVLIFFSCRCIAGVVPVGRLMKLGWFKRFYLYHYYWWVFWVSVIVHVALGILRSGIPLCYGGRLRDWSVAEW